MNLTLQPCLSGSAFQSFSVNAADSTVSMLSGSLCVTYVGESPLQLQLQSCGAGGAGQSWAFNAATSAFEGSPSGGPCVAWNNQDGRMSTWPCSDLAWNGYFSPNFPYEGVIGANFSSPPPPDGFSGLCVAVVPSPGSGCETDFECSLNGVCSTGLCVCDPPWVGDACQYLSYKNATPATGKDLWNVSDARNTWNGPIVTGPDGLFHLYLPIYEVGSLGNVVSFAHGVASVVTGPYDWAAQPPITLAVAENPAALVFQNKTTGELRYSIWVGGVLLLADDPDGPFSIFEGFSYPGGGDNPAPAFHNGAFFLTNQDTDTIWTIPDLVAPGNWSVFATVPHNALPAGYTVEDPFLYFDKRSNLHVINHAYSVSQFFNCSSSFVSSHFFFDGTSWGWTDEPYGHQVTFDDGTTHAYITLERPNLHFDSTGQLTHINFAADLVTGNEGCYNRTGQPGPTPDHTACVNCKYGDHAGTVIVALNV